MPRYHVSLGIEIVLPREGHIVVTADTPEEAEDTARSIAEKTPSDSNIIRRILPIRVTVTTGRPQQLGDTK